MSRVTRVQYRVLAIQIVVGISLSAGAAAAQADGWYAGADVATRVVYTDGTYGSDLLRFKGGYRLNKHVAIETQIMGGDSDSDLDVGGFREWEAGTSYGLFLKPALVFHGGRVDVYGMFGVTRMETTYRYLATGIEDKSRVTSGAVGVGMQYNFASRLSASIDVLFTHGQAKYPHLSGPYPDDTVSTATGGVGINFRF
jgi:opacity protein-like surface antigen